MTAYAIYFSPTRTSERIARAIARGTGADEVIDIDLTHYARRVTLPASALAVIAIPVYGGHLPPLAAERLRGLQGYDTPAVAVVVYGNRAYENALTELAALAGAAQRHSRRHVRRRALLQLRPLAYRRRPSRCRRPRPGRRVRRQSRRQAARHCPRRAYRHDRCKPDFAAAPTAASASKIHRGRHTPAQRRQAAAAHAAAERPAQLYALRSVRHALPERRHCPRRRNTYRRYEMYPVLRMRKVMPLARTHLRHPVRIAAQQMLQAPQSTPDNTVTKRNSIRRCRRQRP